MIVGMTKKTICRNLILKSPHSLAIESIESGKLILDVGCASGFIAQTLNLKKIVRFLVWISQVPKMMIISLVLSSAI